MGKHLILDPLDEPHGRAIEQEVVQHLAAGDREFIFDVSAVRNWDRAGLESFRRSHRVIAAAVIQPVLENLVCSP